MWVYLCLLCTVCGTAYLFQKTNRELLIRGFFHVYRLRFASIGVIIAFLILTFFSVFRDGIGVDYEGYYKHIELIQNGYPHYMEQGFQCLVRFLARYSTNPRWVMIVMSVFTCFFYIIVIAKLCKNIPLSLFLFLTWGYYFFSFNTVRNYFAQSLALVSLLFLFNKKYIKFILCIALASLFHKSALICIPVYLLATKKYKNKDAVLFVFLIMIAFIFKTYFQRLFFAFYPGYEGSVYDTGAVSWLNILKSVFVIGFGLLFYKYVIDDKINRIFFNLNVFSFIFYVGFYWTPEISRIGFYMNTTAIVFIPRLLSNLNKSNKQIVNVAVITGSFVLFFLLMRDWYSYTIQLLPYKTWLGSNF